MTLFQPKIRLFKKTTLYDEASKHHALNPETDSIFNCKNGCDPKFSLLGKGLNGSVVFGPQIQNRIDLFNMINETQKQFILKKIREKSENFFDLFGFEMGLLEDWTLDDRRKGWFPIDQVDFVVSGLSDDRGRLEGSYQQLLIHFLKMDEKPAFSFKMRVSTEADAQAVYFLFSYPKK